VILEPGCGNPVESAARQGGAFAMTESPITVSQALAAHAAAQVAAAQDADLASHTADRQPARPAVEHGASFTVSWASVAMCIGFKKPAAG
jgi:hypothetical protein